MTEEEAKTKWCPMVVFMLGGGQVRNRDSCYDQSGTHCIGSACMMWRIHRKVSGGFLQGNIAYVDESEGYCGLAGKP